MRQDGLKTGRRKSCPQLIRDAKGQAKTKQLEGRTHMTANALIGGSNDTTGAILLGFVREVTR